MQAPILEEVAAKIGDQAKIAKLDVEANQQTAYKYQVASIPTLMIFKDGEVKKVLVGVQQEQVLLSTLKEIIG
jgi:thioredoxin 1